MTQLVGLAFEVHDSSAAKVKAQEEDEEKGEEEDEVMVPSLEDQFHYGFNHVGLIAGPYYRCHAAAALDHAQLHIYVQVLHLAGPAQ